MSRWTMQAASAAVERSHNLDHDVNSFTQRHSPTARGGPLCHEAGISSLRDVVDGLILADLVKP